MQSPQGLELVQGGQGVRAADERRGLCWLRSLHLLEEKLGTLDSSVQSARRQPSQDPTQSPAATWPDFLPKEPHCI